MIKFCAISDLHGINKKEFNRVEPVDVLLIAGDISDIHYQRYTKLMDDWIREYFMSWLKSQPAKKIIIVGGNHDFWLMNHSGDFREMIEGTNIVYLENESYVYRDRKSGNKVRIFGTPFCHKFFNWAFMPNIETQNKVFMKVCDEYKEKNLKCDIILSHDSLFGVSDICYNNGKHIGNPALNKLCEELKPEYFIHGHLHSSNHECEMFGKTKVYNVSLRDEQYKLVYKPLYFELKGEKIVKNS